MRRLASTRAGVLYRAIVAVDLLLTLLTEVQSWLAGSCEIASDRENTRVKDLVDLAVLIQRGDLDPQHVRAALQGTFSMRRTHPVPETLPDAPAAWAIGFAGAPVDSGDGTTVSQVQCLQLNGGPS